MKNSLEISYGTRINSESQFNGLSSKDLDQNTITDCLSLRRQRPKVIQTVRKKQKKRYHIYK